MAFISAKRHLTRGARQNHAEEGLGGPFRRSRGLNRMILMRPAPPCDILRRGGDQSGVEWHGS
jgi:hypothetical protein